MGKSLIVFGIVAAIIALPLYLSILTASAYLGKIAAFRIATKTKDGRKQPWQ